MPTFSNAPRIVVNTSVRIRTSLQRVRTSAIQSGFLSLDRTPSVDESPKVSLRSDTEPLPISCSLNKVASEASRISPTVFQPATVSAFRIRVENLTLWSSVSSGNSGAGYSIGPSPTSRARRSARNRSRLSENACSAVSCSVIAALASSWRNAFRASCSALVISFGCSKLPGVLAIVTPVNLVRVCNAGPRCGAKSKRTGLPWPLAGGEGGIASAACTAFVAVHRKESRTAISDTVVARMRPWRHRATCGSCRALCGAYIELGVKFTDERPSVTGSG